MARGGLYKSDIQKARQSLLAQGKHPSVDAVRVALGNTGSKTTIHRYLKELEADDTAGVGDKVAASDALLDLVGRLAAQLHEEAEARVTEARTQFAAQLKERTDALERQTQEAATLSAQLQRTELALATERGAHAAAEQTLQVGRVTLSQLEERVVGLTARLAEQEAHAASLEQKHLQAREALEHFRASTKEQRDQELRRHEHQVQGLQIELRQALEALTGKNHELMQLNRDNARMTEQLAQLGKELRQSQSERRQLDHQLGELKGLAIEYQALETRRGQELLASEQLRADLATARQETQSEREARRETEAAVAGLKARLQALEDVLAQLRTAPSSPVASTT